MSQLTLKSEARCFDGVLSFYSHPSTACGSTMSFAVFRPPQAENGPVPVLYFLSGLTCTEENFMVKAGAQRYAAEHGLMLVAPDTSPRGLNLPGEDDGWDFGTGAGFYVNATREPYATNYRMFDYVTEELPGLVASLGGDTANAGVCGHSMGGHGALVVGLRHRERYKSVSAFAPICAPMQCPWGEKAFSGYLGSDREAWKSYDACQLIRNTATPLELLVDQGEADPFLAEQLKPELLEAACKDAGVALSLRRRPGYDHGYYFIASYIGEHIAWHAARLKG